MSEITTIGVELDFNFLRDIAPVASINRVPLVMEVHPSVPASTLPEFIAYAKANPGKINMASGGNGGPAHVAGELFKMMAGLDMVHVPYRGEAIEYIKAGEVRPLAVTSAARSEALPDIPTVADFVPSYEASGWQGIGAPKNAPAEIVAKLNSEINTCFTDPKIKARLADFGATVMPGSPADFGKLIADETEKWTKVVRSANIKPE